jgi:hypothetical protein
MYRILSSPRNLLARVLMIGIACLLGVPVMVINIQAIYRWDAFMQIPELRDQIVIRYDAENLLILAIPLVGIFCSLAVLYGILKRWHIALLVILLVVSVLTAGAYLWYDWTYLTIYE